MSCDAVLDAIGVVLGIKPDYSFTATHTFVLYDSALLLVNDEHGTVMLPDGNFHHLSDPKVRRQAYAFVLAQLGVTLRDTP